MTCNSPITFYDTSTLDIRPPMVVQPLSKRVRGTKHQTRQPERQKLEMEVLRNELAVLQRILEQTQELPTTNSKTRAHAQKAFVKRHLKNRLTSEAHQKWLQAAVAGKTTLINDLMALVHEHLRTASVLAVQSQGLYDGVILQPTDELLYAMYIYELDSIYAQTDAVFKSCGMDPKEETTSFQQTTLTTNGEAVLTQCGWKQFFPFSFKPTCDCMWMLAHLLNRQEAREGYDDVKDPQNIIATKFRVTRCVAEGECEALQQRFVHKRFVERTGLLLCGRLQSRVTEYIEECKWKRLAGVFIDHHEGEPLGRFAFGKCPCTSEALKKYLNQLQNVSMISSRPWFGKIATKLLRWLRLCCLRTP